MVLVVVATWMLNQRNTLIENLPPVGYELNTLFNIQLTNPQNAFLAMALLLIAALLIVVSVAPIPKVTLPVNHDVPLFWPRTAFRPRHAVAMIGGAVLFSILMNRMAVADRSAWPVFIWLFVIGLLLFVMVDLDRRAGVTLKIGLARDDVVWLASLLIVGFVVASYDLQQTPASLIGDEGNFYTRILAILKGVEIQSFFGVGVYSYPLPSSFFQTAVAGLFGPSLWSWRFASVLPSVLTIIPLYLFARSAFGRRVAVLSSIALVTLPYLLAYARLGYNNSQSILLVAMCLMLVYASVRRRSLALTALSGVAAGLGFYTYTAGRLGAVIAGLFLAGFALHYLLLTLRFGSSTRAHRQAALRQAAYFIASGVVLLIVTLIVVLPHLVYTNVTEPDLLNHKMFESLFPNQFYATALFPTEDIYRDFPPIENGGQKLFFRADLYVLLLGRGLIRTLLSFLAAEMNVILYVAGPLAGFVGAIFYYPALIVALRRIRHPAYGLLVLWWLGALTLLSVINTFPSRHQHMVPVIPAIAILIGLGLEWFGRVAGQTIALLLRFVPRLSAYVQPKVTSGAVIVGMALVVISGLQTYFVSMPSRYLRNIEQVMNFDALSFAQPTRVVYLTGRRDWDLWVPWIIDTMDTQVEFHQVKTFALYKFPPPASKGVATIVYVDEVNKVVARWFMACLAPDALQILREVVEGGLPAWTFVIRPQDQTGDPRDCANGGLMP
jgi:4-amino-4-deoxy-L-arabinose transferase-like glycosyltransferase